MSLARISRVATLAARSSHFVHAARVLPALGCPQIAAAKAPSAAAFSTSRASLAIEHVVKQAIDNEVKYEETENEPTLTNESKKYLKVTDFKVIDHAGKDWVELRGNAKGDTVVVSFQGQPNYDQPEQEDAENEEEIDDSTAVEFTVRITRGDKSGLLVVNAFAIDEDIDISSIRFTKDESLIEKNPVDFLQAFSSEYNGPEFPDLADELQDSFRDFLKERHIDASLSAFIQDYAVYKEQREYVNLLKNLSGFFKK